MSEYGYFTPPPSPRYYQIGDVIRDIQLESQTLNNFLYYSQIPQLYQYLETTYGPCQGAIFNPSDNSLVYKNQSGQMFYIELVCDSRGVCHFTDKKSGTSFVFQKPDNSPLNWGLIYQLQQGRGGRKMKKSLRRRKSLRKRKTLRRRKNYK